MKRIIFFFQDERGSMVEKAIVMSCALTVASILGAHFLNTVTQQPNSTLTAFFRGDDTLTLAQNMASSKKDGQNGQTSIDYTSTATVQAQPRSVTLDPCTGRAK